jgi:hypothetical protein
MAGYVYGGSCDDRPCAEGHRLGEPVCARAAEMAACDGLGLMRVSWNWTDETYCEHSCDEACEACRDAETAMGFISVDAPIDPCWDGIPPLGAPGGSSWEGPMEWGCFYAKPTLHLHQDPDVVLRAEGFEPEERS